jgi:hypothetical protein
LKERQELGRQKRYRYHVTLNLEEDEKNVFEAMAQAFRSDGKARRGFSEATLELCRIGVACIRYHEQEKDPPQRLSVSEALEAGLTVPGLSRQKNTLYREEEE